MNRYDFVEYALRRSLNKLCDMLDEGGYDLEELTKAIDKLEEMLWDAQARAALEHERKVQAWVARNPEAHPMSGMAGEY